MWALLLIILPGKRDKLFGAKLKRAKRFGLYFVLFGVLYMFVFQIDWFGKGRKEICGSGR